MLIGWPWSVASWNNCCGWRGWEHWLTSPGLVGSPPESHRLRRGCGRFSILRYITTTRKRDMDMRGLKSIVNITLARLQTDGEFCNLERCFSKCAPQVHWSLSSLFLVREKMVPGHTSTSALNTLVFLRGCCCYFLTARLFEEGSSALIDILCEHLIFSWTSSWVAVT